MADLPEINVVTRPEGDHLEGPSTNVGLQLASSLQGVNQHLTPLLGQIGEQARQVQEGKAYQAAMANSGQAFADAVKSGKLAPTQNPWFIQAYERNAAQVRGQAQVSALVADSQTWAERNDPAAFAQKFNTQLGQIAQGFNGIDQQQGFQKAATPLQQDALNANVSYNVQRITQQHVQDATSLSTQAIMDTLKTNPKANPDQIFGAMEDQHKAWVGTGGTEAQWRLIVRQSVIGAGANMGEPGILDVLKAPYLGGQPIANQADETGKPVGLELSSDKFWIERGTDADLDQQYKLHQAAIASEGAKVDTWANQTYGNDYAFGKVPLSTLEADGVKAGFSGPAIVWAADHQGDALKGAAGYSEAQTDVYSQDPQVQQRIMLINKEAVTSGLTPHVMSELTDAVGRQQISLPQAQAVMDRAEGQSHFLIGEANADRRQSASLAREDAGLKLQRWGLVGDAAREVKGQAGVALSGLGFDPARLSAKDQKSMEDAVDNAAMAVGEQGPEKAREAAGNAAATWVKTYVSHHPKPGQPPQGGLANPLRPTQ